MQSPLYSASTRAVFLDKEGTLIESSPGNADRARIGLSRQAVPALHRLRDLGFALVVVSHQPGVAFGRFPHGALAAVAEHLHDLFLEHDLELAGCYFCPHHPQGGVSDFAVACTCRKPQPGLFQIAAHEHCIDLGRSWMIGDLLDDVEAGRRAGCRTVLLDVGNETDWKRSPMRTPDVVARNLLEAAHAIGQLESPRRRLPVTGAGVGAVGPPAA